MELEGLKARVPGRDLLKGIADLSQGMREVRAKLEAKQLDRGPQNQLKIGVQLKAIRSHLSVLGFFAAYVQEDDEYILEYSEASFVGLIRLEGMQDRPSSKFYGIDMDEES